MEQKDGAVAVGSIELNASENGTYCDVLAQQLDGR